MNNAQTHLKMGYVWTICLVAACGGLLFGYDWVVIGGAKPFYEAWFSITDPAQSGWAMSSALLGCIFGALISGWCADKLGRKLPLILSAVLFSASAWGTAVASHFDMFVVYRIVGGVGIGLASALSPLYIAEVSPAEKRGRFVAVNQLTIVDINSTLKSIVATGVVNLVFTIAALPLVDKIGRRKLMLLGASGLTLIYVLIAGAYAMGIMGWPVLLLVLAAIAIYALTLAPVTWVLLAEIFPNRVRGLAMSLGTLALWIACFLLTYTFPLLNAGLGAAGSFLLYGVICAAGYLYILRNVPETKGITLEALEEQLAQRHTGVNAAKQEQMR